MAADATTPMMVQFKNLKEKHPDAILLFRCGDFYETYLDDAVTASAILGITLTHRNNKGKGPSVAMAGFPYHALDSYLPKLIRAGHRVAICDQLEDPKLTKKLVKRGITELVTPGVALTDGVLTAKENNFLAAICLGRSTCGLALLDISTGEFDVAEGTVDYISKLLSNFSPKEVLIVRGSKDKFQKAFGGHYFTFELDDWVFNEKTALTRLCRHFKVHNMKGYGVAHMVAALTSAGAILYYLDDTNHLHTEHITTLRRIDEDRYVRIDNFTMRNLEVLAPMAEDGRSLLQIVDRTVTPMGARMLRRWLSFPLLDVSRIKTRQNGVDFFFNNTDIGETILSHLQTVGDMERLISKLVTGRINPREMWQLGFDLEAIAPIKQTLAGTELASLRSLAEEMDPLEELRLIIGKTLRPDPPSLTNKGGYIGQGVNAELDDLRALSGDSRQYLADMQKREAERTGIQSLKIGFNNVFGYYLEVRNTFKDHVPQEWIRKQTLVNAERYITEELKEYEEKILGAEDKILILEAKIYADLVSRAAEKTNILQHDATLLARLDCLLSMATVAAERHYVRPICDETTQLEITGGRHPVIEATMQAGEQYIPNDVSLDTENQQIIIITGPNMAGKSALLRQTALIVLLAQTGSFVPAKSAHIGIVDKIFTRVGASDNISSGESTFMVEMTEAANIMNSFTGRSLVLFDELGRGTSTYDGISIAWAIVEYLHNGTNGHPRTLFATHYHELVETARSLPRVKNYNVSVKEAGGRVIFLRKLLPGSSAHSFGIHVARMAGMPVPIVKRANEILHELEQQHAADVANTKPAEQQATPHEGISTDLFGIDDPVLQQMRDHILSLDPNNLTPLEALRELADLKQLLLPDSAAAKTKR